MIDICLLGTGGTVPLPYRWLTSLLVRWNGHELLVDCGEGTQIALNEQTISCKHIDAILLTHFHADHTAGLPGLLLSMAKADRTEPITIYGPKGLREILQGVQMIARYVPFEVNYVEFQEKENTFKIDGLQITSFSVKHSVPCFSYDFKYARNPKFDRTKAEENHVPMKAWGILQKNQTITMDGVTYTPDMVLGEPRKGIHFVYSTDTRPTEMIEKYVQDADLYIGEGMYGDIEKIEKAKLNRHSMMQETAHIAKKCNVKQLWFTHYSPSMHDPDIYREEIHEIFENSIISKDGQRIDLSFSDEESLCSM